MQLDLNKNDIIDERFVIQKKLGEGGMGVVYKAYNKNNNTDTAIKFLKPDVTSSYIEDVIRFKREIEAVSKFNHPNIIKFYGTGEYQNTPYLVTELLEGKSLSELIIKKTRFSVDKSIKIIRQLAEVLNYVHSKGIIHRDLKPGNIFFKENKGEYAVKLLDFGLSLVMELKEIKKTEEIIGTFGYMSPEATGIMKKPIDERSDLYSLGVVFYQLLTAELPFKAKELSTLLHEQVTKEATPVTRINSDIPNVIAEIITKLMAKEQDLRYQSAKGLLYDLDRYLKGDKDFIIGLKDQKVKLTYQTRLVGREEEINKIKALVDKAGANEGSISLIGGEPGVGKTRLVETLKEYVYSKGYKAGGLFIEGCCVSQENKTPYQPFRDAMNEYIRKFEKLEEVEKPKEVKRIKKVVGELGEIIIRLNPNMREILGDVPALVQLDTERENQRFLMVASNFFRHISEEGRICTLFLDDLQWADEGSLRLLEEIAVGINKTNLIIIGTYRSNEVNKEHTLTRIIKEAKEQNKYPLEDILLQKVDHIRLNKMIAGILGEKEEYAYQLTDYVLKKSGGNPFFAITILRELVEQKTLTWKDGRWQEDWDKINKVQILGNIVDMVLLRIKDMPDDIDRLLRVCAVIGKAFEMNILYELMDEKEEIIVEWIDDAINRQLLEQSITEKSMVLFIHDRIREAFYTKMTEQEIKTNHLKIGQVIEKINKENISAGAIHESPVLFDLAYHFIDGGDKDKGLKYGLKAAEKAKLNFANDEAIKYYNMAIEILEEKGEKESAEWVKAKEELTDVFLTIGRSDEAIEVSNEILPLKENALEKASVYRKIGAGYFKKGSYEQCEDAFFKGLRLLGEKLPKTKGQVTSALLRGLVINIFSGLFRHKEGKPVREEDRVIIQIYYTLNWVYALTNGKKFVNCVLRMLSIARIKIGHSKELAQSLAGYAVLLECIPLFKKSIKYFEKSIKMRHELNDEWGIAESLQLLGYCYQWKSDYQKSIEIFEQSKKIFEKIGDMWELGMALNGLGQVYQKISEYKKSLSISNRYLNISLKTNDDLGIVASQNIIGHCYIETGDFKDAENILKKALKLGEEKNIYLDNCDTNIYLGRLEIERANYNESIKYLKKAKKIDTEKDLLKEYSVRLYFYLCEAYIGDFKLKKANYKSNKSKKILKKIKKACKNALKATKQWVNHYGASLRVTAKYYVLIKKKRKAEKYFLQSIKQIKSLDRRFELAKGYYEYGIFLKSINKEEESRVQWHQALDIFKQIGAKVYIKRCVDLLGYKEEDVTIETTSQERLSSDRRMTTVLNTGRYLSSILDLEELLEKIMDRTIELVGAERGALLLYPDKDEKKEHNLEIKIFRDAKKITDTDMFRMSSTIQKRMEDDAKPVIIADVQDDAVLKKSDSVTRAGIKSVLSAPIMVKNEMIGNIYLDNRLISGLFKEDDLNVLEMVASQAGVSIENARLYKHLKDQERLKREMEIAERIQTAIVPQPPQHDELEISAVMVPANEVGGDYYDIMFDKAGNLWFAIGDVSGHGVTPGLIMMMAQTAFSINIKDRGDITPKDAIISVNNLLCENIKTRLKESHFMTMNFLKYIGNGKFIQAGAHLDIIVYRNKTKTCELIKTDGVYLGIIPDVSKATIESKFSLNKDDIMLLYTDGITEAGYNGEDRKRKMMGINRLQEIVKENAANGIENMKNKILEESLEWYKGNQTDDITMILVRRT